MFPGTVSERLIFQSLQFRQLARGMFMKTICSSFHFELSQKFNNKKLG